MTQIKCILLVEDSERDIELTLAALEDHRLTNEVVVARDGEEALDYLFCRGSYQGRAGGLPAVVLLLSLCCWAKAGRAGVHLLRAPTIFAWDLGAACRILRIEASSP